MSPEAWTALAAILSALAASASGIAIARINAAKRSADEARDYSEPTGNGYADESRRTWQRIETALEHVSRQQSDTHDSLIRHLLDHAQHDISAQRHHND